MVASGYQTEIARTATGLFVGSSGEVRYEPGAEQYGLTRDINLNLGAGVVCSASGAKQVIASGNNPRYARVNGSTDPTMGLTWTSAAGTTTPVTFPSVAIPDDLDILSPLLLRIRGKGSSAQSTNELVAHIHINGGADVGTTAAFTSAVTEKIVSVASGSLSSAGFIGWSLHPNAHASGTLDIRSAKFTYKSRSRAT